MTDRLLRTLRHWIVVLVAAVLSCVLFRESALGHSDQATTLIAFGLLLYVTTEMFKPVWRLWKWWQRRRPKGQRPELPTPATWVAPREQRRRNGEAR